MGFRAKGLRLSVGLMVKGWGFRVQGASIPLIWTLGPLGEFSYTPAQLGLECRV